MSTKHRLTIIKSLQLTQKLMQLNNKQHSVCTTQQLSHKAHLEKHNNVKL